LELGTIGERRPLPQDVHPNAYAHGLYANFLFQVLRKIAP
jgi:hypothetical protein